MHSIIFNIFRSKDSNLINGAINIGEKYRQMLPLSFLWVFLGSASIW